MPDLLQKYFWVIGLFFPLLRVCLAWSNLGKVPGQTPEMAKSYRRYVIGHAVFLGAPWLLMGVGILIGAANGLPDFLRPCGGNTFVTAFYGIEILLCLIVGIWIWFGRGAEFLLKHSSNEKDSARAIRIKFGIALLAVFFILGTACL